MSNSRITHAPDGIMTCEGCGKDFRNFMDQYHVCTACVKARAAAFDGKCHCSKAQQLPREVDSCTRHWIACGTRRWIACDRCLGTIKQLPDLPRYSCRFHPEAKRAKQTSGSKYWKACVLCGGLVGSIHTKRETKKEVRGE